MKNDKTLTMVWICSKIYIFDEKDRKRKGILKLEMKLEEFDYYLPEELIAQVPNQKRD